MKKNKKEEKKQNKIYFTIKVLITLVMLGITSYLYVNVLKTGMIPSKYILVLTIVLLLLNLLFAIMLLSKKIWLNVISLLLIISFGTVFLVGANYTKDTVKGIKKIVDNKYVATKYFLVTLKDNNYNDLPSLKEQKVGLLQQNGDVVQKELSRSMAVSFVPYDAVGNLYEDLSVGAIQAIVISSDNYELLKEEYQQFEDYVRIIYQFKIKNEEEVTAKFDVSEPFIIYLSGLDTDGAPMKYWRSDVNILLVVNPKTNKILLVNTPRDYFVQLHGTTGLKDKLTHAGIYGLQMSQATLEDLYGIKIDADIKVCYEALEILVDSIDGVDVYSDLTFRPSHLNSFTVKKGMNHFNGKQALAFSQERYAYEIGDKHRGMNQQAVLTAIIKKVSQNKSYLLNYTQVLNEISSYFYTNVQMEDIQELVKNQIDTMKKWNVESISVDGTGASEFVYSIPNSKVYVMVPDANSINEAKTKINNVLK